MWDVYSDLGEARTGAGPIDGETKRLVELALAVGGRLNGGKPISSDERSESDGAKSEGAVHSPVRRALEEDLDPAALYHVALLSIPTLGIPQAIAPGTWIDDLAECCARLEQLGVEEGRPRLNWLPPRVFVAVYPSIQHGMSKSVRISEEFHEFISSHNRADETMEETLRRLVGGPHPEDVAGILSSDTAVEMRERLERKGDVDVEDKRALRDRFE